MIVVDTTAWIDFFAATGTIFDRHVADLIERDAPVVLVDVIYCEVLQGIRDDELRERTRRTLLTYPVLRARGLATFEAAANLYRAARRRRLTIRSTVDCLIAAMCLEAGASIYHNDRDYDALARVSALAIHRPA